MKKLAQMLSVALCIGLFTIGVGCNSGCASKLEPGGAYAPTNALGIVVSNDKALAVADASYKLTYESALSVFEFERENRAALWAINPDIKKALDKARPQVVDINKRWAEARKLYRQNPTPEGLTNLESIMAEIGRLLPVIQSQIPLTASQPVKPTQ